MDKLEIKVDDLRAINILCTVDANIPEKGRFKIEDKHISKERVFKLDTGATHTCINAADLGISVSEEEFQKWRKTEKITAGGIDDNIEITFYKLQVDNFKINDLELGSVPIYVTFYEKMTKALLGMNIIRLLNVSISGDDNKISIEKSNKFMEYKKTHLRVLNPELLETEQFDNQDSLNDTIELQLVSDNGTKLTDEEVIRELFKEEE